MQNFNMCLEAKSYSFAYLRLLGIRILVYLWIYILTNFARKEWLMHDGYTYILLAKWLSYLSYTCYSECLNVY